MIKLWIVGILIPMLRGHDIPNWMFFGQWFFMLGLLVCTERIVKYSSEVVVIFGKMLRVEWPMADEPATEKKPESGVDGAK